MAYSWAPTLQEVAGCIPTRTSDKTQPGQDSYLVTFTANTEPTNTQAQTIIDHAAEDVAMKAGTVTTALEKVAKNAAMWRAAADIEIAYPDRNADVNVYEQLNTRAKYEWDLFVDAVNAAGTGTSSQIPQSYMPSPPWWGDRVDL